MPQGSPGQGFGVSEVGNVFFMQPAAAVASMMNATATANRLQHAYGRTYEVEATRTSFPLSTRAAELALPAATCRAAR